MSTIGSNVAAIRTALGISISELARRAKWDRPNLSRLERGDGGFSKESLERLAEALGVPTGMLFNEGDNVTVTSMGTRLIPVLDYVQAGDWKGAEGQQSPDMERILTSKETSAKAFGLRIKGDSMRPGFEPGDLVVIDPGVAPLPGDFVLAANGEDGALFKQYREREVGAHGRVIVDLHPLNEMYPIIRGDKVEIRIVGTMVEHRRYRKHRSGY